jgi:nicotinamidase-related amidase
MKKCLPVFLIPILCLHLMASDSTQTTSTESSVMKPCLIVIDIQNQYLKYVPERDKFMAMEMINALIQFFRAHDYPIIRVYNTHPEWGPAPDSELFEFPESVNIEPTDPKIIKNYPSAFRKTELHSLLQQKDRNTLFLCGLSAVGCVLATYFDAQNFEYDVFMVSGALMSHKSEYTGFVEEAFSTVNGTSLQVMLKYAEKSKKGNTDD